MISAEDFPCALCFDKARHLTHGHLAPLRCVERYLAQLINRWLVNPQAYGAFFIAGGELGNLATVDIGFEHSGKHGKINADAVSHGAVEFDAQLRGTTLE